MALLLLGAPPAAAAGAPPCLARLELEPSEAFVGQQVLYRLRLLSRDDVRAMEWHEPPAFPRLRAERLPGRPDAGRLVREGVSYRVREEHRALFPERAGEIPIAPARLRCRAAHEVIDLRVPEATLRSRDLPAEGRPADFAGLVGPVALARSVEPRVVALGATLRVAVQLQGGGNLWDARDPLPDDAAFGGAEVFRRRPELDLERGTSLFVRRRFVYDLVPRREGRLVVPQIRVVYFDPAARRYEEARAPAVEVTVEPRAPSAHPRADAAAVARRSERDSTGARRPGIWIWIASGGVLVGAALAAHRRRRPAPAADALAEAIAADSAGDTDAARAALARALRRALAPHLRGAERRAPEEILSAPSLPPEARAAAELLARVERARFDPEAPEPDRTAVKHAIEALR